MDNICKNFLQLLKDENDKQYFQNDNNKDIICTNDKICINPQKISKELWFLPFSSFCSLYQEQIIDYIIEGFSITNQSNAIVIHYNCLTIKTEISTIIIKDSTLSNDSVVIKYLHIEVINFEQCILLLKSINIFTILIFEITIELFLDEKMESQLILKIKDKLKNNLYHIKILFISNKKEFHLTPKCIKVKYDFDNKRITSEGNNILLNIYPVMIPFIKLSFQKKNKSFIKEYLQLFSSFYFPTIAISFIPTLYKSYSPSLFSLFLHNTLFNSTNSELSTQVSSLQFSDPLTQTITNIINKMNIIFSIKKNIMNIAHLDITINPPIINSLMNLYNNNFDYYSTIKNCTGNVLQLSYFNNSVFLYPNTIQNILYHKIQLSLDINDKLYECEVDLNLIYRKIFNNETFQLKSLSTINNANEIIDYEQICLKCDEKNKKKLNLFFSIKKTNRIKIELFIYESVIPIHDFLMNTNYYGMITNNNNNITSLDILDYKGRKDFLKLNENIQFAFEFQNTFICNYVSQEINLSLWHDDNEIKYIIQKEININIDYLSSDNNIVLLNIVIEGVSYKSENIMHLILEGSENMKQIKLSSNEEKKKIFLNISFNKLYDNKNNHYRIIRIYPHLVIRNLTSIINSNHNQKKTLNIIYNNSCNEINSIEKKETNDLYNKVKTNISSKRENSIILNEAYISKIKLCVENDNDIYLSDSIEVDVYEPKDYIISIAISHNKEKDQHLYFLFRVKIKRVVSNVFLITISSFINFLLSPNSFNTIELKPNHELSSFMDDKDENNNKGLNVDLLYQLNQQIKAQYDYFDAFSIYSLTCYIINSFEVIFNHSFIATFSMKQIFSEQNYQIIAYNNKKSNENELNSMIIHKRMMHSPYFICEFYRTFFNNEDNTYLFVENKTNYQQGLYYNSGKNYDVKEIEIEPGKYELYQNKEITSLVVTINKRDVDLIRNGTVMYEKQNKEYEGIFFEMKMNIIRIVLFNEDDKTIAKEEVKQEEELQLIIKTIDVKLNVMPSFLYSDDSLLRFQSDKLLLGYLRNKYLNISLFNFHLQKELKKKIHNIISSQFITDIKIEKEQLLKSFYSSIIDCQQKNIYAKNYRMNFPCNINIDIDNNIIQIVNFILSQFNSELPSKSIIRMIEPTLLSLFQCVVFTKIQDIEIINEIKINEFTLNMNVEYKKGLNFTIKNSKVKSNKQVIKNIRGTQKEIYLKIKDNFMKQFFSNIYSLFASTEIFGNFNDFVNSIHSGFQKLKESTFNPIGIFGFVYDSFGGGIHSVLGIGKSIFKSIHTKNMFDSEIYNIYKEKSNNYNSNILQFSKLDIRLKGDLLNQDIAKKDSNDYYLFDFYSDIVYEDINYCLLCNKYFLCFSNSNGQCDKILPYYHITNIRKNNKAIIMKMNNLSKELQLIFTNEFDLDFIYGIIKNKFI